MANNGYTTIKIRNDVLKQLKGYMKVDSLAPSLTDFISEAVRQLTEIYYVEDGKSEKRNT